MSPAATAHTQGHVWTRWRAEEPPDSPRACKGACDWTKTHISNTALTFTICGLPIPQYPYTSDVGVGQVPADWPKCKKCLKQAAYWGEAAGRKFLEAVG